MTLASLRNTLYHLIPVEIISLAETTVSYVNDAAEAINQGAKFRAFNSEATDDGAKFLKSRQWFRNTHPAEAAKMFFVLSLLGAGAYYATRKINFYYGFVGGCMVAYQTIALYKRYREGNALKKALEIIVKSNLDALPEAKRISDAERLVYPPAPNSKSKVAHSVVWLQMDGLVGRLVNEKKETEAVVFKLHETKDKVVKVVYKVFYIGNGYFVPHHIFEENRVNSLRKREGNNFVAPPGVENNVRIDYVSQLEGIRISDLEKVVDKFQKAQAPV